MKRIMVKIHPHSTKSVTNNSFDKKSRLQTFLAAVNFGWQSIFCRKNVATVRRVVLLHTT